MATNHPLSEAYCDDAINTLLSKLAANKVPESGSMSAHTVRIVDIVQEALLAGDPPLAALLRAHGWTGTQFGSEEQYQTLQNYLRGQLTHALGHPAPPLTPSGNATVTAQDLLGGDTLNKAHTTFSVAMSPLVIASMKQTFGEAPSKPAPVVADAQSVVHTIRSDGLPDAVGKEVAAKASSTGSKQDKNSIKVCDA